MKIQILGSGGSFGSPLAWNHNGNIDIKNKKNFRTRSSILINIKNTTILIDTSPDLRQQLYNSQCTDIDLVLFTHNHADHTSGLPDMRAISLINKKIIPAYMPEDMISYISNHYKYIFFGEKDYSPFMKINKLEKEFIYNDIKINSFKHNHGTIDVNSFRIGNFAYSTDLKKFYNNDIEKLKNLDLWIVGLLRYDPHPSHAGLNEILDYVKYLKPKKTIFTHMTALIDEKSLLDLCPQNVFPGYDGLVIEI
ncbi:MAG: Ribonuclease BN [Alphaproteobacteria bacterium MarineAlpha5_Bin9]|nr:MAG: Ribonuclease BN [Alphaproteobacteria bacterium MarineAlpha5_Bin9]|tara:strand:+ start:4618 stop:5370 length:753 start_codon:yes stop_codon:yes gene_type:complete